MQKCTVYIGIRDVIDACLKSTLNGPEIRIIARTTVRFLSQSSKRKVIVNNIHDSTMSFRSGF